MASPHLNRSGELEVFVRVIELGGFSAAARACGMTPSAVSKLVTRLEHRLGTRLVNRSTRQLQLTAEGCAFYERGVRILADLDEAERCASAHAAPRGRVRVNANVPQEFQSGGTAAGRHADGDRGGTGVSGDTRCAGHTG